MIKNMYRDNFFTKISKDEPKCSQSSYFYDIGIFIAFSNMIGLFGLVPPTMDLNVTLALSLMSIVLVELAGIIKKGPKKWLKSFTEPMAVITFMNVFSY